jgi:hypothetical protein
VLAQLLVLAQQLAGGQRSGDGVLQRLRRDRLDQVLRRATLDRPHRRIHLVQRGDHHHLDPGKAALDVLEHLHPVPVGEEEIGDHHVVTVGGERTLRLRQLADRRHLVTGAGEIVAVHDAGDLLIVDEEDPRHPRLRLAGTTGRC